MKRFKVDKLVRDKTISIDDTFVKNGIRSSLSILDQTKYRYFLAQKLHEEANEVLHAKDSDELKAELADVLEVVESIANSFGLSKSEVESIKQDKKKQRGGFARGIYNLYVDVPLELEEYIKYYQADPKRYPEMQRMLCNQNLLIFHQCDEEFWGETEIKKYVFRVAVNFDQAEKNRPSSNQIRNTNPLCIIVESIVVVRQGIGYIHYIGPADMIDRMDNEKKSISRKQALIFDKIDYTAVIDELLKQIEICIVNINLQISKIILELSHNKLFANIETQIYLGKSNGYSGIPRESSDIIPNGSYILVKKLN